MAEGTDPTFYRSPAAAIAAPPEKLAYVAALDPAGSERDAMTVVRTGRDCPTVQLDRANRLGTEVDESGRAGPRVEGHFGAGGERLRAAVEVQPHDVARR